MSLFRGASIGQTLTLDKSQYSRSMREARRELKAWERDVDRGMKNVKKAFSTMAKVGAVAIAAGLAVAIHEGTQELNDMQKASAQTASAITAQGKAAYVTKKYVEDLAGAMLRKTGIDDQAIQTGENLILTMARLDNSTGQARTNFTRATQVMADLSVRMGTDTASAAKVLSKALADPEKASGKLGRVIGGLTKAQQAQVEASVKAGDEAKAQALILDFVGKKVKGAAAAYGKTAAGQIAKAREEFASLSATLVSAALPSFLKVLHAAEDGIAAIQDWAKTDEGREALADIADAADTAGSAIMFLARTLAQAGMVMAEHSDLAMAGVGALASFMIVTKVAAGVQVLQSALNLAIARYTVYAAATEGATVAQWAFNRAIMANPIGLLATGVSLAVGALIYFNRQQSDAEQQADRTARALRGVKDAIYGMNDAVLSFDESKLQLKMARVALADARIKLRQTTKGTREYRDAQLNLAQAALGLRRAEDNVKRSRDEATSSIKRANDKLAEQRKALAAERDLQAELAKKIAGATAMKNAGGRASGYARVKLQQYKKELQESKDRAGDLESKMRTLAPAIRKTGDEAQTAGQKAQMMGTDMSTAIESMRLFAQRKASGGGRTVKRQRGGMVPGSGTGDRIPALLEPGEGVINKRAVAAMGGPSAVMAINASIPRFQKGGVAGLAASAVNAAQVRADRPVWYLEKLLGAQRGQLTKLLRERPRKQRELDRLTRSMRGSSGAERDRLRTRVDNVRTWLRDYNMRRNDIADEIVSLRQEIRDKRSDAAAGDGSGTGVTMADVLMQLQSLASSLNQAFMDEGGNMFRRIQVGEMHQHFTQAQVDPANWKSSTLFQLQGVGG